MVGYKRPARAGMFASFFLFSSVRTQQRPLPRVCITHAWLSCAQTLCERKGCGCGECDFHRELGMPCALIRFSFRSTGGVANQFSIHFSRSLHLVSCVLFAFCRIDIKWHNCCWSFFVALAVQGVVKCCFGASRTRFPMQMASVLVYVCVVWRCFSSLIIFQRTPLPLPNR